MTPWHALTRYYRTRQAAGAIARRDLDALAQALARGADPDGVAKRCPIGYRSKFELLIHTAVLGKWSAGVALLLQHGADAERRGGIGNGTALFLAGEQRDLSTLKVLAEHGANPQGLGWCIDYSALDRTMALLGWDYPSQANLATVREMTADEVIRYFNDSLEIEWLDLAKRRHAVAQCLAQLEAMTADPVDSQARLRPSRL